MTVWPKAILRTIGVMDLLFAVFGIWMVEVGIRTRESFYLQHPGYAGSQVPYEVQLYWGDVTHEMLCLIFLVLTGMAVIRLQRRGLWMTNALFTFEIVRFLAWATAFIFVFQHSNWTVSPLLSMIGAANSVQGVTPQIITGCAVIALIGTNIAYRKLPHAKSR